MIDSQVQAFAELGRLFRQMQVESFADPVTIEEEVETEDLQPSDESATPGNTEEIALEV